MSDSDNQHIHFGVTPSSLTWLRRQLNEGGAEVLEVEGDGWSSWGEAVGTDANDASTLHVVAEHEGYPSEAVELVNKIVAAAEASDRFQLATANDGHSTLAAITTDDDYNVDEAGGFVWSRTSEGVIWRAIAPPSPTNSPTTVPEMESAMPVVQPGEIVADALLARHIAFGADPNYVVESGPGTALVQHVGQQSALGISVNEAHGEPPRYLWVVGTIADENTAPETGTGTLEEATQAAQNWITETSNTQKASDLAASLAPSPPGLNPASQGPLSI